MPASCGQGQANIEHSLANVQTSWCWLDFNIHLTLLQILCKQTWIFIGSIEGSCVMKLIMCSRPGILGWNGLCGSPWSQLFSCLHLFSALVALTVTLCDIAQHVDQREHTRSGRSDLTWLFSSNAKQWQILAIFSKKFLSSGLILTIYESLEAENNIHHDACNGFLYRKLNFCFSPSWNWTLKTCDLWLHLKGIMWSGLEMYYDEKEWKACSIFLMPTRNQTLRWGNSFSIWVDLGRPRVWVASDGVEHYALLRSKTLAFVPFWIM